jgi:hypothetical protein
MPGQNAARTMLKHFHLEDKGGRLGVIKELMTQRKKAREKALKKAEVDPYSSGQNDPFPAEL